MKITKRVEFDAGHRVPSHKSKCRNMHGHRYVLEVTLKGPVKPIRNESDDGMVIDFGDVKRIAEEKFAEPLDHAFVVYAGDDDCRDALCCMGVDHKTVVVDFIPTAENLAQWAADMLNVHYQIAFGTELQLESVRLYETPNSWADASPSFYDEGEGL